MQDVKFTQVPGTVLTLEDLVASGRCPPQAWGRNSQCACRLYEALLRLEVMRGSPFATLLPSIQSIADELRHKLCMEGTSECSRNNLRILPRLDIRATAGPTDQQRAAVSSCPGESGQLLVQLVGRLTREFFDARAL